MKRYLLELIKRLETWSDYPTGPCERKSFNVDDYSLIGMGVLIDRDDNYKIIPFEKLLNLIDKGDASEMGMGPTPDISLLFYANKVTACQPGHIYTATAIGEGDEESIPPIFISFVSEKTGTCYWQSVINGNPVDGVNIEYVLSTVLLSEFYFQTFFNAIRFNLSEIAEDHVVDEITHRLTAIHEKLMNKKPHAGQTLH